MITPQHFSNVRSRGPLVHCITNYVTVNDCANILLACGASPIMADDESEVEDITRICDALVVNIGTLNRRTVGAMERAKNLASALGHPTVFDPVGVGASAFRRETARRLLAGTVPFSVIRGNLTEIRTLAKDSCLENSRGVDASLADVITEENCPRVLALTRELAKRSGSIAAVSGAWDVISDGRRAAVVRNGHPMMPRVTGSGCMLSALVGAFAAANPGSLLESVAAAFCAWGLAGERAFEHLEASGNPVGNATYRNFLIDEMCVMDADTCMKGAKVEFFE